jgi:hypothetical protein
MATTCFIKHGIPSNLIPTPECQNELIWWK